MLLQRCRIWASQGLKTRCSFQRIVPQSRRSMAPQQLLMIVWLVAVSKFKHACAVFKCYQTFLKSLQQKPLTNRFAMSSVRKRTDLSSSGWVFRIGPDAELFHRPDNAVWKFESKQQEDNFDLSGKELKRIGSCSFCCLRFRVCLVREKFAKKLL